MKKILAKSLFVIIEAGLEVLAAGIKKRRNKNGNPNPKFREMGLASDWDIRGKGVCRDCFGDYIRYDVPRSSKALRCTAVGSEYCEKATSEDMRRTVFFVSVPKWESKL